MNYLHILNIFSIIYAGVAVILVGLRLYGIIARRLTDKGVDFFVSHVPVLLNGSIVESGLKPSSEFDGEKANSKFSARYSRGSVRTQLNMVSKKILSDNVITDQEQILHSELILALYIKNKSRTITELNLIIDKNGPVKELTKKSIFNLGPSNPDSKDIRLNFSESFRSVYGGFLGDIVFRLFILGRLKLYTDDFLNQISEKLNTVGDGK